MTWLKFWEVRHAENFSKLFVLRRRKCSNIYKSERQYNIQHKRHTLASRNVLKQTMTYNKMSQ